jgi:hypothetical protein
MRLTEAMAVYNKKAKIEDLTHLSIKEVKQFKKLKRQAKVNSSKSVRPVV